MSICPGSRKIKIPMPTLVWTLFLFMYNEELCISHHQLAICFDIFLFLSSKVTAKCELSMKCANSSISFFLTIISQLDVTFIDFKEQQCELKSNESLQSIKINTKDNKMIKKIQLTLFIEIPLNSTFSNYFTRFLIKINSLIELNLITKHDFKLNFLHSMQN